MPTSSSSCWRKGADVNARAARGQTALMWAAAQKHPDVVKVLLAHGADVHARSEVVEPGDGGAAARRASSTTAQIPHGGDTALMFAARVGDLSSAKLLRGRRRQRERRRCVGRQRHGACRARRLRRAGRVPARDTAPTRTPRPPGSRRCTAAIMRRDESDGGRAARPRRRSERAAAEPGPPRAAPSKDFNFAPELVGATPFWLAARFSAARRHAPAR